MERQVGEVINSAPPEDPKEEIVCRVCHCEAEISKPLFHPCKCDGTIKFIHEECLLLWLKSKSENLLTAKCELCGERFCVKRTYGSSEDPALGYWEFTQGLLTYFCQQMIEVGGYVCKFALWFLLPLFLGCWSDLIRCVVQGSEFVVDFHAVKRFNIVGVAFILFLCPIPMLHELHRICRFHVNHPDELFFDRTGEIDRLRGELDRQMEQYLHNNNLHNNNNPGNNNNNGNNGNNDSNNTNNTNNENIAVANDDDDSENIDNNDINNNDINNDENTITDTPDDNNIPNNESSNTNSTNNSSNMNNDDYNTFGDNTNGNNVSNVPDHTGDNSNWEHNTIHEVKAIDCDGLANNAHSIDDISDANNACKIQVENNRCNAISSRPILHEECTDERRMNWKASAIVSEDTTDNVEISDVVVTQHDVDDVAETARLQPSSPLAPVLALAPALAPASVVSAPVVETTTNPTQSAAVDDAVVRHEVQYCLEELIEAVEIIAENDEYMSQFQLYEDLTEPIMSSTSSHQHVPMTGIIEPMTMGSDSNASSTVLVEPTELTQRQSVVNAQLDLIVQMAQTVSQLSTRYCAEAELIFRAVPDRAVLDILRRIGVDLSASQEALLKLVHKRAQDILQELQGSHNKDQVAPHLLVLCQGYMSIHEHLSKAARCLAAVHLRLLQLTTAQLEQEVANDRFNPFDFASILRMISFLVLTLTVVSFALPFGGGLVWMYTAKQDWVNAMDQIHLTKVLFDSSQFLYLIEIFLVGSSLYFLAICIITAPVVWKYIKILRRVDFAHYLLLATNGFGSAVSEIIKAVLVFTILIVAVPMAIGIAIRPDTLQLFKDRDLSIEDLLMQATVIWFAAFLLISYIIATIDSIRDIFQRNVKAYLPDFNAFFEEFWQVMLRIYFNPLELLMFMLVYLFAGLIGAVTLVHLPLHLFRIEIGNAAWMANSLNGVSTFLMHVVFPLGIELASKGLSLHERYLTFAFRHASKCIPLDLLIKTTLLTTTTTTTDPTTVTTTLSSTELSQQSKQYFSSQIVAFTGIYFGCLAVLHLFLLQMSLVFSRVFLTAANWLSIGYDFPSMIAVSFGLLSTLAILKLVDDIIQDCASQWDTLNVKQFVWKWTHTTAHLFVMAVLVLFLLPYLVGVMCAMIFRAIFSNADELLRYPTFMCWSQALIIMKHAVKMGLLFDGRWSLHVLLARANGLRRFNAGMVWKEVIGPVALPVLDIFAVYMVISRGASLVPSIDAHWQTLIVRHSLNAVLVLIILCYGIFIIHRKLTDAYTSMRERRDLVSTELANRLTTGE